MFNPKRKDAFNTDSINILHYNNTRKKSNVYHNNREKYLEKNQNTSIKTFHTNLD